MLLVGEAEAGMLRGSVHRSLLKQVSAHDTVFSARGMVFDGTCILVCQLCSLREQGLVQPGITALATRGLG